MRRTCAGLLCWLLIGSPAFAQTVGGIVVGQVPGGPPGAIAQPPRDTSARTGTSRIRGRVVAADTGEPLRRAIVRVFAPELRENRMTTTDAQGAYELKDLPAGRYTVTANKGSYVSLQYGQTRPNQPGRPLQILDGQSVEKVDFALPHGSVITGRVVDEFGEPIADVMVTPMRQQAQQGRRRLMPSGRMAQTNDIGEFRLFGLSPGNYYVSATWRDNMGMGGDTDNRTGYAPTYYPGTPNSAEAQRITVGVGQTVSDVNISLVATSTARISGTVIDSQGQPVTRGGVSVMQRAGNGFMGGTGGPIKPDGTFSVSGLAPGDYTLRANIQGDNNQMEFASANVTVGGADISGVQLTVAKPITASGRIVVSDVAAAQTLRPAAMNLFLQPMNPDDMPMGMIGGPPRVKDDFTFEIRSAPGRFRLNVNIGAPGWSLKAVRQSGADITDTGLDLQPGSDISDIEIELTNHPAQLSGVVTNSRGETLTEYTVVYFPQDREKWMSPSRYIGMSRPDQEGRFKVRSLPPGTYYAVALDSVDPGEFGDPDFFDRVKDKATTFTLSEGETKVIDLRLQAGS